jgi:glucokinase
MGCIVALDIGGTQLRIAVYPHTGTNPRTIQHAASRGLEAGILERLTALIDDTWPDEPVDAIAVAVPGPTNPRTGIVISTPNIPAWKQYPLAELLSNKYQVPVYLGNDANLAALGEWKYGAGQGHHDLVYITISTGIGGGVISNDMLIEGWTGMASELGHVTVYPGGPICSCGIPGHLEAVSSGPAIARYVSAQIASGRQSSLSSLAEYNARDIYDAARLGDQLAEEAFIHAGMYIGQAMADFLHMYNPSILIFGGGVSQSGRFILDSIKESMRLNIMNKAYLDGLEIAIAKLGDEAGLLGALAYAHIRMGKI